MRKWSFLTAAAVLTIGADQLSKAWAVSSLALGESMQPIPALAPYFQLTRSMNTGAAFGILSQAGNLLLALAFAIIAAMLWQIRKAESNARWLPLATGIVVGGRAWQCD